MTGAGGSEAGPVAFVTGGTGFVGSHLVEELLRRGYREIRCLVRTELKWLEGLNVVPVRGTLFDRRILQAALHDVDYVYHVGGVTRAREEATFRRENVEATIALLEVLSSGGTAVRRVLVTSSLAAIGQADGAIADETFPMNPVSAYGRSKAEMEQMIAGAGEGNPNWFERLPITIIRPPVVYGPRERDLYTLFQTANRGLFPVLGSGRRPDVSLVHVSDLVRGMADAAEHPAARGRTYFVGSDRHYSWREVQAVMSAALGRRALRLAIPMRLVVPIGAAVEGIGLLGGFYPPFNREKAREARDACKMCSSERASSDFGYSPHVSLEDGFRETVQWYREEGWLPGVSGT